MWAHGRIIRKWHHSNFKIEVKFTSHKISHFKTHNHNIIQLPTLLCPKTFLLPLKDKLFSLFPSSYSSHYSDLKATSKSVGLRIGTEVSTGFISIEPEMFSERSQPPVFPGISSHWKCTRVGRDVRHLCPSHLVGRMRKLRLWRIEAYSGQPVMAVILAHSSVHVAAVTPFHTQRPSQSSGKTYPSLKTHGCQGKCH